MKKVNISRVVIKGFGSIQELEYNLDRPGLNIIVGENGVGKTTLFNAIFWCLYGKTSKGVVATDIPTLKEYRPRGFKGTFVQIDLEIDQHPYRVIRTYKSKHSFEYVIDTNDIALIDLTKEENILNNVKLADSQKVLEGKLGMDAMTFQNSVFFGQKTDRLMDSPDGDKRKIFEDILSHIITDLDLLKEKVQEDRNNQNTEIHKQENKLQRMQGRLDSLIERHTEMGKDEEHAKEILQAKIQEIKDRIQLELTKKEQAEERKRVDLVEHKRVVDVMGKLQHRIKAIEHRFDFKAIEQRYIDYKAEHTALDREISQSRIIQEEYSIQEGDICDTCGSEVTSTTIARVKKDRDAALLKEQDRIKNLSSKRSEVLQKLKRAEDHFKYKNALEAYKDKMRVARERYNSYREENERNDTVIKEVGERVKYLNEREIELIEDHDNKLKEIAAIQKEITKYSIAKEDLEKEIGKLKDKIKYLDWWSRIGLGSGGVATYLYESLLVSFNNALSKYSQVLGMAVRLTIDKTKKSRPFLLECYDNGVYKNYKSLSGGEQQRVNIGILFALYEVISSKTVSMNILLLDEVFEGLDESGTSMVFEIMKIYEHKSIYVITHNKDIVIDSVEFINVHKTENGTVYD